MLRALAYFTPSRSDTRLPQDDQTNQLKGEVPPVTPEDSPQLVMGPGLRHEEDDEETSFLQPEPKEEPRDNDQVKQAAQHTILTEPDEERKGPSEVLQSEQNKDRSMRREDEFTTGSSSSAGDLSESGANSLPPDDMEEQAGKEEIDQEELDLKGIFLMMKNQLHTVNVFQKRQEEMQLQQQALIIDTVKKSVESETKITHRLIQDHKEEIMNMLHSPKKIDWSEYSSEEDDSEDGRVEEKSIDKEIKDDVIMPHKEIKDDLIMPHFIKISFGDHRPKPKEAVAISKKLSRERSIIAGTMIEFQPTNIMFTELSSKSQRRKAIKLAEKANRAQHNDLGLARNHIKSQAGELETGFEDISIWEFLNYSFEYGNLALGKTDKIVDELFRIPIGKLLEDLMVLPGISEKITKAANGLDDRQMSIQL